MIGTWGWGNGFNGSGMIFGSTPKEAELTAAFRSAVNNDLIIFDTAPVYGEGSSEKLLGKFSGNNSKIIISTKYFPAERSRASNVKKSFEKSLLRLERETADILWLHQPVNIENNMKAMAELVIDGKVKHIGISNADIYDVQLAQNTLSRYNIKLYGVQNHYSLIFRKYEDNGLLDYCQKNDIEFWAYMLLEQGALTGIKKLPAFSRRGIAFGKSNHSRHLHAPLCVIFTPNSGYIARYAPFIWCKSPTNCDAHLTESIFQTRSRERWTAISDMMQMTMGIRKQRTAGMDTYTKMRVKNRHFVQTGISLL